MARVRTILAALWTVTRRNSKSLASFSGNNLYYLGFGLLLMQDPGAFVLVLVILGLVLIFPLSSDPLQKIPRDRLALWPLSNRDYWLLRVLSPWLNPLTWFVAAIAVWKRLSLGLWALLGGLFAIGFVAPRFRRGGRVTAYRRIPHFPGPLDQLVRKNLREIFCTLDFFAGLVLSVPALFFRAAGLLPSEALLPLTLVVMLTISTYAQTLFGLDGEGGLTRYRLLPIAGWQILIAKDAAFLLTAVLLTLPLAPVEGFAAALMALACGHHASVIRRREQMRWRFQTSASFGSSVTQIVVMILAGSGTAFAGAPILIPCNAASTWWLGRAIDQAPG
ncbi:MAG: hypothetical protein ACRD8O_21600 [Bryobacteraceae bacterium]